MRGKIKWYHTTKHIGFLVTDDNREVFVHINDCQGFTPEAGIRVNFEFGVDGKGRTKAVRIQQLPVVLAGDLERN
jgi:cold shock CspA family protein